MYKHLIQPILFQLKPENAHKQVHQALKLLSYLPGCMQLLKKSFSYTSDRLSQTINGIEFKNPLGIAAGFDKSGEFYPFLANLGFGFVEVGTITGEPQEGNPQPRLFRYKQDQALINRMGFNNPGSDVAYNILCQQKKSIPRGINAGKTKLVADEQAVADYVKTFKKLIPLSDYAVINISSPNTPGLRAFQEKTAFIQLINGIHSEFQQEFGIPMFVKLAPDLTNHQIEELLDVILSLHLNGVILTNTTIDTKVLSAKEDVEKGGISGKPLQKRSTELIRLAFQCLKGRIPIIGVGGIDSGASALEKIQAGASLIQIYTGYIYEGPLLPRKILSYLDEFMEENGIKNISELIGTSKQ